MGNPSCCINSSPGCKRPICKPKRQPTLYGVRAVVITSRRNLTQKKKSCRNRSSSSYGGRTEGSRTFRCPVTIWSQSKYPSFSFLPFLTLSIGSFILSISVFSFFPFARALKFTEFRAPIWKCRCALIIGFCVYLCLL